MKNKPFLFTFIALIFGFGAIVACSPEPEVEKFEDTDTEIVVPEVEPEMEDMEDGELEDLDQKIEDPELQDPNAKFEENLTED